MAGNITWPLVNNIIRGRALSNTFGNVRTNRVHQGWDFAASVGTTAYAVADGTVEFVQSGGDYGNQICIKFNYGSMTYYAFYAHMQSVSKSAGDSVRMNDEIGRTGKTGNAATLSASEDHLHFEIRTQAKPGLGLGGRVSPLKLYKTCPLTVAIPG